jgi:hypothetical protein
LIVELTCVDFLLIKGFIEKNMASISTIDAAIESPVLNKDLSILFLLDTLSVINFLSS